MEGYVTGQGRTHFVSVQIRIRGRFVMSLKTSALDATYLWILSRLFLWIIERASHFLLKCEKLSDVLTAWKANEQSYFWTSALWIRYAQKLKTLHCSSAFHQFTQQRMTGIFSPEFLKCSYKRGVGFDSRQEITRALNQPELLIRKC